MAELGAPSDASVGGWCHTEGRQQSTTVPAVSYQGGSTPPSPSINWELSPPLSSSQRETHQLQWLIVPSPSHLISVSLSQLLPSPSSYLSWERGKLLKHEPKGETLISPVNLTITSVHQLWAATVTMRSLQPRSLAVLPGAMFPPEDPAVQMIGELTRFIRPGDLSSITPQSNYPLVCPL